MKATEVPMSAKEKERLERMKSHVKLDGSQAGESIQKKIIKAMRANQQRLQDLFKQMDTDGSKSLDREEYATLPSKLCYCQRVLAFYCQQPWTPCSL